MHDRVEVGCYAGGRGDETPRVVLLGGREVTVQVSAAGSRSRSDRAAAHVAAGSSRSNWRMAAAAAWRSSRMVRGHSLTRRTVVSHWVGSVRVGAARRTLGAIGGAGIRSATTLFSNSDGPAADQVLSGLRAAILCHWWSHTL